MFTMEDWPSLLSTSDKVDIGVVSYIHIDFKVTGQGVRNPVPNIR